MRTTNLPGRRGTLLVAATGYLLFVVYGSLVPLDFNPRPLQEAWNAFLGVRYFMLGVESRSDWVANLLLYMPLAYLFSAATAAEARPAAKLLRTGMVFVGCAALALAVEFTQLFFPPRTVSLNDILAEFVGSAFGIAIWFAWGGALDRLWTQINRGGPVAFRAAAMVYALAYLVLSLYPFDFYVSMQEFSQKFVAGGAYGLIMAPAACDRWLICAGKLGAEALVVVPLGILFGMALGRGSSRAYLKAAACGLALGLVIEVLQLFIASGVSQGVSLLTRVAGMCLGVAVHRCARWEWLRVAQPLMRPIALLASLPYFFALMWYNGLLRGVWVGPDQVRENFAQVHWLPFYYHYYTSETVAFVSLLANVAMYVPVGVGCWLWRFARVQRGENPGLAMPAAIAFVLAAVIETGKLLVGKHPDPTNVLIGAASAALTCSLLSLFLRWSAQDEPATVAEPRADSQSQEASAVFAKPRADLQSPPENGVRAVPLFAALLVLAAVGFVVISYPLPRAFLSIAMVGYGILVWRWPSIALPAVLALLPVLSFGQWTGWVLVNEFDLLMGVTVAALLLRWRPLPDDSQPTYRMSRWVIPLTASFLISAAIGFFPLQPFDHDALSTYWSNYNSLRTFKGFFWACALLPLAMRQAGTQQRLEKQMAIGMILGLCAEAIMIVWERLIFTGLFNFSNDYRAIGTFPELHTGGGDVHAYLVLAIPFVALWVLLRPGLLRVAAGVAIFGLGSYALAVTFTRGGYVGYIGALLVLGIAIVIHGVRQRAWKAKGVAIAGVLAIAGLAVMAPIVLGSFMQARVASAQGDANIRLRHWTRAIDMMDGHPATTAFGMGLGSFPRTFLLMARGEASATFSYKQEGGNGFVRMGSGNPLYLGQRVSIEAGKNYTLAVDLRSASPNARISASICEKSEQSSFQCKGIGLEVKQSGANWQSQETRFNSDDVGSALGRLHLTRPVFLSFSNPMQNTVVDIDNVRLLDESNRELVANGDFSQGGAHWFFAADDHAPWHIFNLWVEILFEQGWFGLIAFSILVAVVLARLAGRAWAGEAFAGILLAAISGYLLIGLTESLFDGPRVTTLFFLLLFTAGLKVASRHRRSRRRRSRSTNAQAS